MSKRTKKWILVIVLIALLMIVADKIYNTLSEGIFILNFENVEIDYDKLLMNPNGEFDNISYSIDVITDPNNNEVNRIYIRFYGEIDGEISIAPPSENDKKENITVLVNWSNLNLNSMIKNDPNINFDNKPILCKILCNSEKISAYFLLHLAENTASAEATIRTLFEWLFI